jgi:hypothetical protein
VSSVFSRRRKLCRGPDEVSAPVDARSLYSSSDLIIVPAGPSAGVHTCVACQRLRAWKAVAGKHYTLRRIMFAAVHDRQTFDAAVSKIEFAQVRSGGWKPCRASAGIRFFGLRCFVQGRVSVELSVLNGVAGFSARAVVTASRPSSRSRSSAASREATTMATNLGASPARRPAVTRSGLQAI